jgi:cytochrome c oxidase subunit 2
VGRPVTLQLASRDVIHSLYLPSFRTKIDAIPGSVTRLWFQAQEAGRFEIGCAQHCGVGHYKMRGLLFAEAPADYARWSARAEEDARLRYDPAEAAAQRNDGGWAWDPAER